MYFTNFYHCIKDDTITGQKTIYNCREFTDFHDAIKYFRRNYQGTFYIKEFNSTLIPMFSFFNLNLPLIRKWKQVLLTRKIAYEFDDLNVSPDDIFVY